jgi:proteic killer suppression protein
MEFTSRTLSESKIGKGDTEKVFQAEDTSRLPHDIQKTAYRRLLALHAATSLKDLRVLPGNRLEKLKGDRAG